MSLNPQEFSYDDGVCWNCQIQLNKELSEIPGTSEFMGYCSEQCRAEAEGEVQ